MIVKLENGQFVGKRAQFDYKAENETSELEIDEHNFVLREDGASHSSCLLWHLWTQWSI